MTKDRERVEEIRGLAQECYGRHGEERWCEEFDCRIVLELLSRIDKQDKVVEQVRGYIKRLGHEKDCFCSFCDTLKDLDAESPQHPPRK